MIVSILLAATLSTVKHGTQAECQAWYPGDWKRQELCLQADPKLVEQMRPYSEICGEFAEIAKTRGLPKASAKFETEIGPLECNYTADSGSE